VQKFIIFKQEMKRSFFSPSQGKKRYMYVLGNFNFLGYKPYSLSALIDTIPTICSCRWNALPSEKWMLMKSPIAVKGIDGKEIKIEYKAKNVAIWMSNKKFVIPKILCFPNMHGDFLLGNNFISNYLPMQIHYKFVALTFKKELVNIPLLEQHKYKCLSDFTPTKRGESHTKTCKCFICNEEGRIAPQCPKKGKGGKKMIKFLEEQEFVVT
jgi:hypothetical protein